MLQEMTTTGRGIVRMGHRKQRPLQLESCRVECRTGQVERHENRVTLTGHARQEMGRQKLSSGQPQQSRNGDCFKRLLSSIDHVAGKRNLWQDDWKSSRRVPRTDQRRLLSGSRFPRVPRVIVRILLRQIRHPGARNAIVCPPVQVHVTLSVLGKTIKVASSSQEQVGTRDGSRCAETVFQVVQ